MTVSTVAVCCDDLGLMSDARRLCATAGLDAEVVGEHDAPRWWSSAAAVLLDEAVARRLLSRALPRRERVAVLTRLERAEDWRVALGIGAEQVSVLPDDERGLLDGVLTGPAEGGAVVVACVSAHGGAGSSTVAAAVALAAARRGTSTLLVDGDPRGGGLDVLFGMERSDGVRWPDLAGGATPWPPATLPDDVLAPTANLRLLSWGRTPEAGPDASCAWTALLPAARACCDLVVVDLSRPSSLHEVGAADAVLLVVRAGVRQAIAAAHLAAQLSLLGRDVRIVVRRARRASLGGAEIAAAARLPLALEVREDERLAMAADEGQLARLLTQMPVQQLVAALLSPGLPA